MMNLQKNKWDKSTLEDCCEFFRGVTYSNKDEVDYDGFGILRANNIDLNNKINFQDIKRISSDLIIKEEKRLKKNDIFICTASGSLEHIGKVAFVNSDTEYFAGGFMGIIRPKTDYVNPYFLFSVFLSPLFQNLIQSQRAGTNIQNLKFSDIANNEIPLPSEKEQTQIAELFQSIETTIEQAEQQENNLLKLKKL